MFTKDAFIEMASIKNGQNHHTFSFGANHDDNKMNEYGPNIDEWHCYLFEFRNRNNLVTDPQLIHYYNFRISALIQNFEMESGYDFLRVFINGQYDDVFTGKLKGNELELVYRVNHQYLKQWERDDIGSFEMCFFIETDDSIGKSGFEITTKIEYENPEVVVWRGDQQCYIEPSTWRNTQQWNGKCGVGIQRKKISHCDESKMEETKGLQLHRGVCRMGESETVFCQQTKCGSESIDQSKVDLTKSQQHWNGYNRIDPTFADPFVVQRSTNRVIDIEQMIKEIKALRTKIVDQYGGDERLFTNAMTQHQFMEDSELRLGRKLARSLVLGDTFHAVFTGSSNTAGHDNMFMSSHPMQLQSIMRPLWKKIGFKGAAFRVSNRAVGGAINTNRLAWCIPQFTSANAEKVDLISWESQMNDEGGGPNAWNRSMEQHIRNTLTVPGGTFNKNIQNRPLWHALIAGSGTPKESVSDSFDDGQRSMHQGFPGLVSTYSQQYGAGIVEFVPKAAMAPMMNSTSHPSSYWIHDRFYVNWHPGPQGHRLYAEMIAHFYLGAVLKVLETMDPIFSNLKQHDTSSSTVTKTSHILEVFKLLQDPPYDDGLAPVGRERRCDPVCTRSDEQFCIFGYNPKDRAYDLRNYVMESNGWKYKYIAGNPQSMEYRKGGQGSMDTKFGFEGNRTSGELVINLMVTGNRYVMVETPYADKHRLDDTVKTMGKWFKAEIKEVIDLQIDDDDEAVIKKEEIIKQQTGKILRCESKDQSLWTRDFLNFGCQLKFEYAGKYSVAFTVDTEVMIPICVIASY